MYSLPGNKAAHATCNHYLIITLFLKQKHDYNDIIIDVCKRKQNGRRFCVS